MFTLQAGRRGKWGVVAVWVLLLVAVFPLVAGLGDVQSDDATDQLPGGAESTLVHQAEDRIPGSEDDELIVVYHRDGGLADGDKEAVARQHAALARDFKVDMPPVPSEDGTALMYAVGQPASGNDAGVARFVERVRAVTADRPSGLRAEVTGPAAIDADVDAVFEGIDTTLMLVTVIVVAVLLIITYRSPFLWLVPLLTVGTAAYLSMALVRVVAGALDLTVSTQSSSVMIVMVFGAGTDYALLIVARYREQLRHHRDVHAAMRAALKSVGPAILASGSTVALGLGCLFVADMNDISGIGVIGALGILATLVTMLTLFPAVLTALGRKVFWPRVPALASTAPAGRDWWRWVFARPLRSAGVSALALGLLGLGVFGLSTDLRQADSFTNTPESVTGFATLDRAYPGEGGRPFTVATPTDLVAQVLAVARATDKVVSAEAEREGNGWSLVDVVPAAQPDSDDEAAVIKRLRADLPAAALVGGEGAERVDVQEASAADTKLVIPLVLTVVLLVLFLLLRSLVASLLVVAAVVLSYLAALGLGSVVFEHVLGFGGVEPTLPVLVFVFLVAFGVDYAIFLVARIAEDRKELGTTVATRRAVRATAPVIASAGLVLAATFAVLASLPFVPMVEMGVVVAVGVLLQTLLVAPALLAPMMVGLRRWIWWPSRPADNPQPAAAPDESVLVGKERS
ncbi:MMPL family transporter [Kribbella sp. C-35]|uniref:MMPL family transporter n=1 Tax=Kribbella sp. C-35 TaxID=2789276 RepID=UPI00397A7590